jgi:hypothetical protein
MTDGLFDICARAKTNPEREPPSKNMRYLPETFYLAQEVGKMLG